MKIFATKCCRSAIVQLLFVAALFGTTAATTGNKVVVVPLLGDGGSVPPFAPVAAVSPPDADYLINDNGTPLNLLDDTVSDTRTGLIWQRVDDNNTYSFSAAMNYFPMA